jgi:hypothetical protein
MADNIGNVSLGGHSSKNDAETTELQLDWTAEEEAQLVRKGDSIASSQRTVPVKHPAYSRLAYLARGHATLSTIVFG